MSRFSGCGDAPARSGDDRHGSYNNNKKDSGFGSFSRDTFGTAKEEPASENTSSNNTKNTKVQRPVKDSESWDRVDVPKAEAVKTEKSAPKPEQTKQQAKSGGIFSGLDSDDDEHQHPEAAKKPVAEKKAEKKVTSPPAPVERKEYAPPQVAPRFASIETTFSRTIFRDERPRGGEDRPAREHRADRDFTKPREDFAGGSRFAGFDGPSTTGGDRYDRPRREERPQREDRDRGFDRGFDRGSDRGSDRGFDRGSDRGFDRGSDRGFDRGSDRGFDRGDYNSRQPTPAPQPVTPKEEPKTVMAGTNKDGNVIAANMVTEKNATGTAGLSQIQTQSASWGANTAATPDATAVTFGGSSNKVQNKDHQPAKPTKSAVQTQLQKAVDGKSSTVSLGQLKKNMMDVVPFPTTANAKENFATAIANAVSQSEYSISDVVAVFNQQFVNAYGTSYKKEGKDQDEGKKVGVDVAHQILVVFIQTLLASDAAQQALVAEYFKGANATILANFTPNAIFSLTDDVAKKTKCVEFFKANGLTGCLSAQDGNESAAAAAAVVTLDAKISSAVIALPAPVSASQVTTILTPSQADVKAALAKDATAFLTQLFVPCVEANLPKETFVAILDALFSAQLITYDTIETWQSKCDNQKVKRELVFKISGWLSAHKPQIQSAYDDEEDEEPFDDGF